MGIEKFFTVIKDGAWHSIDELSAQLALPTNKLIELSDLLSSHGLLKYENETNRIRIVPKWRLLLPIEENPAEPKTSAGDLHSSSRKQASKLSRHKSET